MKVLVIGGAGFIGSHVVRYHLSQGDEVGVIDNFTTGREDNIDGLDCFEPQSIVTGMAWSDQIYMLAGSVGVKYVNENPSRAIINNLEIQREVFELNEYFRKPLLFASTSEVYGDSKVTPFKESQALSIGAPDQGRWGYSCSKLMGEFLALHSGFPAVVVRFFNITGVGQLPDYGMVLPNFIHKALRNEPIEIYGDGRAVRCFCDVEETVPLLSQLLDNERCYNQVYNVGNSENRITIEELANLVVEKTGSSSSIIKVPFSEVFEKNPTDIIKRVPSTVKVWKETAWTPQMSTEDIIQKMVDSGVYSDINK